MHGSKSGFLALALLAACGAHEEPPAERIGDPVSEHGPAVALLGSWAIGGSGRLMEVRCVEGDRVTGYLAERDDTGYRRYATTSRIDGLIVEMSADRASYSVTVNLEEVSSLASWLVADEIPARLGDENVTLRRLDAVGSVGPDCSVPWDADQPGLQAYGGPLTRPISSGG